MHAWVCGHPASLRREAHCLIYLFEIDTILFHVLSIVPHIPLLSIGKQETRLLSQSGWRVLHGSSNVSPDVDSSSRKLSHGHFDNFFVVAPICDAAVAMSSRGTSPKLSDRAVSACRPSILSIASSISCCDYLTPMNDKIL